MTLWFDFMFESNFSECYHYKLHEAPTSDMQNALILGEDGASIITSQ